MRSRMSATELQKKVNERYLNSGMFPEAGQPGPDKVVRLPDQHISSLQQLEEEIFIFEYYLLQLPIPSFHTDENEKAEINGIGKLIDRALLILHQQLLQEMGKEQKKVFSRPERCYQVHDFNFYRERVLSEHKNISGRMLTSAVYANNDALFEAALATPPAKGFMPELINSLLKKLLRENKNEDMYNKLRALKLATQEEAKIENKVVSVENNELAELKNKIQEQIDRLEKQGKSLIGVGNDEKARKIKEALTRAKVHVSIMSKQSEGNNISAEEFLNYKEKVKGSEEKQESIMDALSYHRNLFSRMHSYIYSSCASCFFSKPKQAAAATKVAEFLSTKRNSI